LPLSGGEVVSVAVSQKPTFEEHCQYILGIIYAWGDTADEQYPVDFSYIGWRCHWGYPDWYRALIHLIRTGWIIVRPDGNLIVAR